MDPLRGLLALVLVFVAGIFYSPVVKETGESVFLQPSVQTALFRQVAEFGILAAGMTFVILTGGIDLSVGSVLAFSSMTFAHFLINEQWPTAAALGMGLGAGLLCGLINGAIISWFNLQPFVVTLAMMVFARGAARWISNSEKIQTQLVMLPSGDFERQVPWIFTFLDRRLAPSDGPPVLRDLFVVTVAFLIVIAIGYVILSKTHFGRLVYAIGGNEEAARYSGIRTALTKTAVYGISGLLAGVAGIFGVASLGMGDPSSGLYRELDAIAAVVIGGTTLTGGRGGILLTLLGVLIIGYIDTILSINNVSDPWRLMSKGLIIVLAVLIQQRRSGR